MGIREGRRGGGGFSITFPQKKIKDTGFPLPIARGEGEVSGKR